MPISCKRGRRVTSRLLFETAEIAKFTPQEKTKFEYDMRTERDLRNQIAYAEEKGREEGREEERIRQEAKLRTIEENLRKRGLSEEDIAELMKES